MPAARYLPLPRALVLGTGPMTVLYLALNVVYLCAVPPVALAGQINVGHIAAGALFGLLPLGDVPCDLGIASELSRIILERSDDNARQKRRPIFADSQSFFLEFPFGCSDPKFSFGFSGLNFLRGIEA